MTSRGRTGFTLVELLVVVALIALLISILLPGLRAARHQAQATVCGSNIRQLAIANLGYATECAGRFCPGAIGMRTTNLHRWHGTRPDTHAPFDPAHGPLTPFLTANDGIRACPSFHEFVRGGATAFEKASGGYGYNQAYLGRILNASAGGSFVVQTDAYGVRGERVRRAAATIMFTDAAFAGDAGLIEYSFVEPRFHPEYLQYRFRADPSLHFRHRGTANIAWCDGHVGRERRTFTHRSGLYLADPERHNLGWFGTQDDNGYFDLQ